MQFRSDESCARSSDLLIEPASRTVVELDLYDELSNFSALSPEQQRKELERVALPLGAHASVPAGAEEQRKELERVALAPAPPAPAAENRAPATFDFIKRSDLPNRDGRDLDQSAELAFSLIDGSQLEPPDLPDPPRAQPIFAFIEETADEPSKASEDGLKVSEAHGTLGGTSPLADLFSGVSLTLETALRCESCGAASTAEDLFCLSCGELVGETTW